MKVHKRNARLIEDYIKGLPTKELEAKYNISHQRIYQIFESIDKESFAEYAELHWYNKATKKANSKYKSMDDMEEYLYGARYLSIELIAKELKISSHSVLKLMEFFKIESEIGWTKDMIISVVRYLYNEDTDMSTTYIQGRHRNLHATALRRFGSWKATLKAAGVYSDAIKQKKRGKPKKYDKNMFPSILRGLYESGVDLAHSYIIRSYPGVYQASRSLYHDEAKKVNISVWQYAVEQAGIDYDEVRKL